MHHLQLEFILGGDHLREGVEAIQATLENPILRPHWAWIEAKRLGFRFGKRQGHFKAACQLLDEDTVMSAAEIYRAAALIEHNKEDIAKEPARQLYTLLQSKLRSVPADQRVMQKLDGIGEQGKAQRK
jgi:hypothetical protein